MWSKVQAAYLQKGPHLGGISSGTETKAKLLGKKIKSRTQRIPTKYTSTANRQLITESHKNKGDQSREIQCLNNRLNTTEKRNSELENESQKIILDHNSKKPVKTQKEMMKNHRR